jgi:hypothetical protein
MAQGRSNDGRFLPRDGAALPPRKPRGLSPLGKRKLAANSKIRIAVTPSEAILIEKAIEAVYHESAGVDRKRFANVIRKLNGEGDGGL